MSDPVTTRSPRTARLRVPEGDGDVLAHPPLAMAADVICRNQHRLERAGSIDLAGRSLAWLREAARGELLAAAGRYTSELRPDVRLPTTPGSLIVTGHQPELFHPGVWAKNFAAAELAVRQGGTAINLVVDNDLSQHTSINVPGGSAERVQIVPVPLDAPLPAQPWEERPVSDPAFLRQFPARVHEVMDRWGLRPIVDELWQDLPEHLESMRLADVLTRLRSRAEVRRGAHNLELPVSRLSGSQSYLRYLCHMLVDLPRFHEIHNRSLLDYRKRNRLRSKTHPVPELEQRDGWYEAPFWSWRQGDHLRRHLFARQITADQLVLSDGERDLVTLRLGPEMDACCAIEQLAAMAAAGERLRPRALSTTIFARLLFSDVFIHGIGGAKYDEMTDEILTRFYGCEPPDFFTVSATLQLLGDRASGTSPADVEALQSRLRDLRFRPEDWIEVPGEAATARLIEEKAALVAEQQAGRHDDPERNRWRYGRLREINRVLSRLTESQRKDLERQLREARAALENDKLLRGRDFSFCLYPAEQLETLIRSVRSSASGS